jgi:hypothetical protein
LAVVLVLGCGLGVRLWHDSIIEILEPRLGPLTDNFWTVSALFSASQSWQNFLVIKDEKYFCLVYGLFSPPIGQDFLSATFVLSWRQDFAKKADLVFAAFFGKSWPNLGKSWKICIEKRCYVKILEKIRTMQNSRRLKIKRTKNLGKSLGALYTKIIFFAAKRKEDGGGEGKGEAYV